MSVNNVSDAMTTADYLRTQKNASHVRVMLIAKRALQELGINQDWFSSFEPGLEKNKLGISYQENRVKKTLVATIEDTDDIKALEDYRVNNIVYSAETRCTIL